MRDNLYRVYTRAEKRVAATCYSAWTIDEPWGSSKGKKSRFFVCTWAAASHSSPPTLLALFPVLPTLEDIESIFIYFFFHFFFIRSTRLEGGMERDCWLTYIVGRKVWNKKSKNQKETLIEEAQMQSKTHWHAYKASLGWLAHAYVIYINTNPCSSLFSSPFCMLRSARLFSLHSLAAFASLALFLTQFLRLSRVFVLFISIQTPRTGKSISFLLARRSYIKRQYIHSRQSGSQSLRF